MGILIISLLLNLAMGGMIVSFLLLNLIKRMVSSSRAPANATTASATDAGGPGVPVRNYDVFLNHRGPDVKKSFVSHLHAALEGVGARTFVDNEELRVGDECWDAIESAIRHSKVHMAVFSPGYADSSWCLRELREMLECRTAGSSQLFLPVFFNVAPSDLRHLKSPKSKSCYSKAFAKLRNRNSSDVIDQWILALDEASMVTGRTFDSGQGFEARLVKLIVSDVLQVLKFTPLSIAKHPVGVDEKRQEALDLMEFDKVQPGLHKLAICGMGGVGKTTLAKSIYNQIHTNFDGSCFIESVRREAQTRGLPGVQELILRALLKSEANIDVSSTSQGKQLMSERFLGLKTLIILDDIDSRAQLEALVSPFEACRLKDGSHLVITSRDEQIVTWANVQRKLYMDGLSEAHANLLFNYHAFLRPEEPPEELKALAKEAVKACGGLPLALEALGAHLYDKDLALWEETVKAFERGHPMAADANREVTPILKISYDGLCTQEKIMFLDVACIMLGQQEDSAKRIWCELGLASVWLENLRLKSLVKVDQERRLTMHDLLRDMGRAIVERSHPINVWQRSHLWDETDVQDVLRRRKGAGEVRAVRLDLGDEGKWNTKSFARMDSLRFLVLTGRGNITGDFGVFPKQLRWLQWHQCPWESLPRELDLSKVVVLDLTASAMSSLSNGHMFENLRELRLLSASLKELPDFRVCCKKLEVLDLSGCPRYLKRVPESISYLSSTLTHLNLYWCINLTTLPDALVLLHSLKSLRLDGCVRLTRLPDAIGQLTALEEIGLKNLWSLVIVPQSLGSLTKVSTLDLWSSQRLLELPSTVGNLRKLSYLRVTNSGIREIPAAVCSLTNLVELISSQCAAMVSVPEEIGNLCNLERLDLAGCKRLSHLPSSIGTLGDLETLDLSECNIKEGGLPKEIWGMSSLRRLDLSCNPLSRLPEHLQHDGHMFENLRELILRRCSLLKELPDFRVCCKKLDMLDLSDCCDLESVPESIGCLSSTLTRLDLRECRRLTTLPDALVLLHSLESLKLDGCTSLTRLPDAIGQLAVLEEISLRKLNSLVILPQSLGSLAKLSTLDLSYSERLQELPSTVGNLRKLSYLDVSGTGIREIPAAVCSLANLVKLISSQCAAMASLAEEIGNLCNLERLDLVGCKRLSHLPSSIGALRDLETLDLSECNIEEGGLPKEIWGMSSLRHLDLSCNPLSRLPEHLQLDGHMFENLRQLSLRRCSLLKELPDFRVCCKKLEVLDLSNCRDLESVPESIGCLSSTLTRLNLHKCGRLTTLPDALVFLHSLKSLRLDGCTSLTRLPDDIGQLTALEEINLRKLFSLVILPQSLGSLAKLSTLDLSYSERLQELPSTVVNLRKLSYLDVSGTGIREIPAAVCSLTNLVELISSGCAAMVSLPEEIGNLCNLEKLDLMACNIGEGGLPKEIWGLSSLRLLDLSFNPLSRVPEHLHLHTRLHTLHLAFCEELREIPQLPSSLEELNTNGCENLREVRTFPPSLIRWHTGNCPRLKRLPSLYPRDGLAHLEELEASICRSLRNDAIKQFAGLASLRRLYLNGTGVSFGPWIKKLVSLEELMLDGESLPECFIRYKQEVRVLGRDNNGFVECYIGVIVPHTGEGMECKGVVLCAANPSSFVLEEWTIHEPGDAGVVENYQVVFNSHPFEDRGSYVLQVQIIRACLKGGTVLITQGLCRNPRDMGVVEVAVRLVHEDHEFEEIRSELALAGLVAAGGRRAG